MLKRLDGLINSNRSGIRAASCGLLALIAVTALLFFSNSASAEELVCAKCHKYMTTKKYTHTAMQMGCTACHIEPHKKDSKFKKGLSADAPDLCYGCHDKSKFTKKNIHPPVAGGMCSSCHENAHTSENKNLLMAESPDLCFNCHDKNKFSGKKVVHAPVAGGMCPSCHAPHSSDAEKLISAAQPDLCFTCHDRTKFENKAIHAPVAGGMCTSCHLPHQGDNEKLLTFSQPDLCYGCHDKADFTKKNVHAAVMMGCTSCHSPHANKSQFLFEKGINPLCLTCHPNVSKTPHAVAGFGKGGHPLKGKRVKKGDKIEVGKDPMRPEKEFSCSSCHNPHSSDSVKLFRYKANSAFELCSYCHKV